MIFQYFAAEPPEGIDALGLDPWAILAQAVTFLVLFWLVKKFAMDKIVDALEERRKKIDDGVRLGREMEEQQKQLDQRAAEIMKNARVEADRVIKDSEKSSAKIIKEAQVTANKKADKIIADAHTKIEDDITKSRRQLESEMRVLVAEATEVILGEKIDQKKDETLLTKAVKAVKGA